MKICHNIVDRDLHWVVVPPVVVQDGQRLAKVNVRMLRITIHEVGLDQDAVELDRLSVEWTQEDMEDVDSHLSFRDCHGPHFLA